MSQAVKRASQRRIYFIFSCSTYSPKEPPTSERILGDYGPDHAIDYTAELEGTLTPLLHVSRARRP